MAEILFREAFQNQKEIHSLVWEVLAELGLKEKLYSVRIKHPPKDSPLDMNYLYPEENLLELEIVDSVDNLEGRIRHELMHVADQLDPAFYYNARKEPKSGTTLLRRYKYLWNVYIDSRLLRAGKPAYATREQREDEMGQCYPELGEDTRLRLFEHLWNLYPLTHKQLLQLSKDAFKFSRGLKALAKTRGERLRKFKSLKDLEHFAQWGEVAEG